MAVTIANPNGASHRVIGEKRPAMLKADLPKREKRDMWAEIGGCLDVARRDLGWTVDQLAGHLERDSKQVGRWLRGEERPQVDAVFNVPMLREPFVIALAKLAQCAVETVVTIRRRA
jgi:ribosome-binding protein aMBF1 (putative translation factor)